MVADDFMMFLEGSLCNHSLLLELHDKAENAMALACGNTLVSSFDLAGAEPLYRSALATAEKALGRDDPSSKRIREELDGLSRKHMR